MNEAYSIGIYCVVAGNIFILQASNMHADSVNTQYISYYLAKCINKQLTKWLRWRIKKYF